MTMREVWEIDLPNGEVIRVFPFPEKPQDRYLRVNIACRIEIREQSICLTKEGAHELLKAMRMVLDKADK